MRFVRGQIRTEPDGVQLLGPQWTLRSVEVLHEESHPRHGTCLIAQVVPESHERLLKRDVDGHEV